MVRHSKPRAGSLGFWPRKRTKRIYPRVNNWSASEKPKIPGFAGYKAGMTHVLLIDNRKHSATKGEEISVPVTVLDCPPLMIVCLRFYSYGGNGLYVLDEIWTDLEKNKSIVRKLIAGKRKHQEKFNKLESELEKIKKIRAIVQTNPHESGVGKKKPEIFEMEITGSDTKEKFDYAKGMLGKEVKPQDIFKAGDVIDVVSVSKGKGTQGPIKRFGVKRQKRKDKKKRRHIGTLGSEKPGRVPWTIAVSGQLGFQKRTEINKRIVKIGEDGKDITPKAGFTNYGIVKKDYILISGSIPGPRKRLIILRPAIRHTRTPTGGPEIKYIHK